MRDFARGRGTRKAAGAKSGRRTMSAPRLFLAGTGFGVVATVAAFLGGPWLLAALWSEAASPPSPSTGAASPGEPLTYEFIHRLPRDVVDAGVEPFVPPAHRADAADDDGESSVFLLQAAAFQSRDVADAMRAELILEGLDVSIAEMARSGSTWYRVLVGPFRDRDAMEQARTRLRAKNIPALVLEQAPP